MGVEPDVLPPKETRNEAEPNILPKHTRKGVEHSVFTRQYYYTASSR